EVGTTNRTRRSDYEAAIGPETAVLLRVHQSNFRTIGFTEEVTIEDLCALAREHGLAVVDDLGSGALHRIHDEPTVRASVAAAPGGAAGRREDLRWGGDPRPAHDDERGRKLGRGGRAECALGVSGVGVALIMGTAGHVDHGKTALVRALTGTDTDRLAEERRRGLSIELGFAELRLPDGRSLGV